MTKHFDTTDPLLSRMLRRSSSLFAADVAANHDLLEAAIAGRRVLVVGAAGSIGHAFVRELTAFRPAAVHLVDLNENTLVEVVRDLRSTPGVALPENFLTVSVDFGSRAFAHFVNDAGGHDVFVNFSAMKHVRSERDVYSLMRMIEVNVEALDAYLTSAAAATLERAFSVSTDKSVRPVNLMGATKNLMERVLFAHGNRLCASSARFANVAFSAGSLLEGFERRLEKGQPIAAPNDVRRYFISHQEAGQLCLLGCFLAESRQVAFPKLSPDKDLVDFATLARLFLAHHGYQPQEFASEAAARGEAHKPGYWPCLFAPSDTTGEKAFEEFFRTTDLLDTSRFQTVGLVRDPAPIRTSLDAFLAAMATIRASESWNKADVVAALRVAVPELQHSELARSLDQKM